MVIWKYTFNNFSQTIDIPIGAKLLNYGTDLDNNICIWVLIPNPNEEIKIKHTFHIIYTGVEFLSNKDFKYIGTVKSDFLIYHIFEKITDEDMDLYGDLWTELL